ncbi:kinase-like domain-containing protein [Roridomyces roridus]|uniref:Kinase-like domain-containing protein n=1 Tax=Roridomyces roridus TaxID=1738132 RepID=A0AAD7C8A1_9AGAR|nr:kinase-like domain-containing protein [Roridomyces roridus]
MAENPTQPTITTCCSDTPGDGCGLDFPGKTEAGICQKCKLLDSLDSTSPKYQEALAYPQCLTCGVAWKRLPHTDKCGSCHQKALAASGLVNHSLDTAIQARSNAFSIRTNRPTQSNSLANKPPTPTIPLNTAALDQFRNVGHNDADCIKVFVEMRIGKTLSIDLGKTSRPYPPNTPMSEVIDDILQIWNVTWTKSNTFPLTSEKASLRFHGNQNIIPTTEYLPILDFYQMHKSAPNHEAYFTKMPKQAASTKGKVLALEIYMSNEDAKGPDATSKSTGTSTTLKRRKEKENDDAGASKRPRVSGSLQSAFVRTLPGPEPTQSTKIKIVRAKFNVDPDICDASAEWPSTFTNDTEEALISNDIFKSGAMKHCYKLSISDKNYIAKRFFEIGKGRDEVTLKENAHNLTFDAIRCVTAAWFLDKFQESAAQHSVQVAQNFEITDVLLVEEVIEDGDAPSPASGVTREIFEAEPEASRRIVWMLEPLRNANVTHYSGTNQHPAGSGQLAHTLYSFVHFAYEESNGTVVFADVQGSPGRLSTNAMGMIIFDLMTHTDEGDSGVGDFGEKGIARWRKQHDCNAFCKALELGAGESDDEEDGE